jgi:hypothetical protein
VLRNVGFDQVELLHKNNCFAAFGAIIPLVILMFRKKDGGISVVAKKRSAIGTFF